MNPPNVDWHGLSYAFSVSKVKDFRQQLASWPGEGKFSHGSAEGRADLDVWGKFAFDVSKVKAEEREESNDRPHTRRQTKPLRMIITGGAGSGKSTTIRALVGFRRGFRHSRDSLPGAPSRSHRAKELRVKGTAVLCAPTGTASFQMKHGASTLHSTWSVPTGFCGPLSRQGDAYKRLKEVLEHCDLAVFDEMSMNGRATLGKVNYRVLCAQDKATKNFASAGTQWMAGKDVIMAGHLAQAQPIGDDPVFKTGPYTGKGLNRPPKGRDVPEAPDLKTLSEAGRLFLDEFEDVSILRATHRVDLEGEKHWSGERKARYGQDAQRFLEVTRRMADLEWDRDNWRRFSKRNKRNLLSTAEGRAEYEREFANALLLMDVKQRTAKGEDGADAYNSEELDRLSTRTGEPILGVRALHKQPVGVDASRMEGDQFRGLAADLRLCVGARVLLTMNRWVEAGLVNGAAGFVRGFVFPEGFDPNSADTRFSTPLCVIVEFDDVNLGMGPAGHARSFFPDDPGRARWVPIFPSAPVSLWSDASIAREQFPLVLAWAMTHWKAQGMTLRRVRVLLRRAASILGVGYVAVTRVKHPDHLVFEEDLPAWETFQDSRRKPLFRQRRRMELRYAARFSRTLRKYRFCEADVWTREEACVAEVLLAELRRQADRELGAARFERGKCITTEDSWPWPSRAGPDVVAEMRVALDAAAQERRFDGALLESVAERLMGDLHMPTVREALRCLIPDWLDSALDAQPSRCRTFGSDRVGVNIAAKGWRVDVSAEGVLRAGRPLDKSVLEFFLGCLCHVCVALELPVYDGPHAFGREIGGAVPTGVLRKKGAGWK